MSLSRSAFALSSLAFATLAACGSGPTDGPKTPDEKLVVGGVLGDAGVTTSMAAVREPSSPSRPRSAVAEPKRPVDEEAYTLSLHDALPIFSGFLFSFKTGKDRKSVV